MPEALKYLHDHRDVACGAIAFAVFLVAYAGFWLGAVITSRRLESVRSEKRPDLEWLLCRMRYLHSLIPALFIGVGVALIWYWLTQESAKEPKSVEALAEILIGGYFIYQVIAGGLFATTSVKISSKRLGGRRRNDILLDIEISRGSKWLVVIVFDGYAELEGGKPKAWQSAGFWRFEKKLNLGPGERTSHRFLMPQAPSTNQDVELLARVDAYSILWPALGTSFARTVVPAYAAGAAARAADVAPEGPSKGAQKA